MMDIYRPVVDAMSEPFWQAVRGNRLLIQRCSATGRHQWYPRAHSLHAPGAVPEWVEASGRGEIVTWSTIHRGPGAAEGSYICALIRLEEGVVLLSTIEGADEKELATGSKVRVDFRIVSDELTVPTFRLEDQF